jgi:Transport and Golgi organisation 2
MCTISFLPTAVGFRLAMNRDEKRTRVRALAPEVFQVDMRRAIYPHEPDGGTWLAANDAGFCLALINWHRIERKPSGKVESRGNIIPGLIGARNAQTIARELGKMSLRNVRSFRLIAIDSRHRALIEWQWDVAELAVRRHGWQILHWFSSGYDERQAETQRADVCKTWRLGKPTSLKSLHASHLPRRGPFSICMHRPDAATVSYSEVVASGRRITLRYHSGPPCRVGADARKSIALQL